MEKRKRRVAKGAGSRICNRCDEELPATPEIFLRDSTRPLGLAYECRRCHSARKAGRDRRPERWVNMTTAQKEAKKKMARAYYAAGPGRAISLVNAYRKFDAKRGLENDLTVPWFVANIVGRPCVYCASDTDPAGCERLDNAKGHTMDNVVPACGLCNRIRGDSFSPDEMKVIGRAVAAVRAARAADKPSS
jgi:hypothetical protein